MCQAGAKWVTDGTFSFLQHEAGSVTLIQKRSLELGTVKLTPCSAT
jgi:hypothetical protein